MIQFEVRDNHTNKLYGTLTFDGYPDTNLIEFVWHHIREDVVTDDNLKGSLINDIVGIMNNMGFDAEFCPVDDSNYTVLV